ncbi:MAG: DNA repair protein RecO [Clostridia bacterium]|nr:DNA repair protein RecO [Clostridia bacterium]
MTLKTRGLVIREQKVSDGDCVVTLLTEDRGVIRVWTKGIFNPKTRNAGARLFCYSEFTLYKSRERYTLNSADLAEGFFALRRDITVVALCSYISQVIYSLLDEYAETAEILPLVLNCFHLAAEGKKPLRLIKACFELRLASILGYTPLLGDCEKCGKPDFPPEGIAWLELTSGALRCEGCREAASGQTPVTPAALLAMRHIVSANAGHIFSFSLGDENLLLLGQATEKYLLAQCGRGFPALDFYKGLE